MATADGYGDDAECSWALRCPAGSTVSMTIAELDTERSYDFVNVFDGSSTSANRLGRYSGSSEPADSIDASGSTMLVTLESDGGITHNGLSASFTCMAPPPPPPSVCRWHDDGECDESGGTGLCDAGTDTADCTCRWANDGECDEDGTADGLCAVGTDTDDCSCRWTNDNQCDEPGGLGLCAEGTDADDCACRWSNDGQCDDPSGTSLCPAFTDVNDCSGSGRRLSTESLEIQPRRQLQVSPSLLGAMTIDLCAIDSFCDRQLVPGKRHTYYQFWGATCSVAVPDGLSLTLTQTAEEATLDFSIDNIVLSCGPINWAVAYRKSWAPDMDARGTVSLSSTNAAQNSLSLTARITQNSEESGPGLVLDPPTCSATHTGGSGFALQMQLDGADLEGSIVELFEDDIKGAIVGALNGAVCSQTAGLPSKVPDLLDAVLASVHPDDARYQIKAAQKALVSSPEPKTTSPELAALKARLVEHKQAQPPIQSARSAEKAQAVQQKLLAQQAKTPEDHAAAGQARLEKLAVAAKGNPPPPLLASSSAPAEGTGDESPAVATQLVGGPGSLGPAWTRDEIEPPAGERDMGSYVAAVYTEEQQERLNVDEFGVSTLPAADIDLEPPDYVLRPDPVLQPVLESVLQPLPRCSGRDRWPSCSVEDIMSAMWASPDDLDLQDDACDALADIAEDPSVQAAIVDAGGVERVVSAMATFPDESHLQGVGAYALRNLARDNPSNRAAIGAAGGIEAVMGALRTFEGTDFPAGEESMACKALDALAEDSPSNVEAIVAAGGIGALDAVMTSGQCRQSCMTHCQSASERLSGDSAAADGGSKVRS